MTADTSPSNRQVRLPHAKMRVHSWLHRVASGVFFIRLECLINNTSLKLSFPSCAPGGANSRTISFVENLMMLWRRCETLSVKYCCIHRYVNTHLCCKLYTMFRAAWRMFSCSWYRKSSPLHSKFSILSPITLPSSDKILITTQMERRRTGSV